MNNFDLDALFDEAKEIEIKAATEKSTGGFTKFQDDDRYLHFKPGNTYTVRLLYYTEDPSKRKLPFIAKYDHSYWDEEAESNKLKKVTCPTSEYILYNAGFSKCPICKATRKFYKDKEAGSTTAEELYKEFRRKFHGFALVYVVNDPTNEDNNGKVKIMHFGITINKYFKYAIFGRDEKGNIVESEDALEKDAFKLKGGYNLKIIVGRKGEYNEYTCEFARKKSNIDITMDDVAKAAEELRFDEDHCTFSTDEELQEFYKTCVLAEEVKQDDEEVLDLGDESEKDEIPMEFESDKKEEPASTEKEEPEVINMVDDDLIDDDIDVDDILDGI